MADPAPLPTIAHVLHRLYVAGAEVLAANLARRLRGRYEFVFLCLDEIGPLGTQLSAEGFRVLDLRRRPGVDLSVARRIRQACAAHGIGLLHAHQYTPFFYAAMSRRLHALPPVLFTEHGRHYPDARRPKRVFANRFLLRQNDRVTAVGQFVKQAVIDNEGIAAERIEVIHNGIDPAEFTSPPEHARTEVRAELGLPPDTPLVLQVARFHPVKDHATALRAFANVIQAHAAKRDCPHSGSEEWGQSRSPSAPVLLLAGDGDGRPKAQSLAAQLGLDAHVRFLGVRHDVARLMGAADVFLLSSLSEGISVTLIEAMAAALPVAATDVGGNAEVVRHKQTGLLSPRSEPGPLGESLWRLLRDADLRRRLGQAGQRRMLAQFHQDQMHDRYQRLYDQMLARTAEA